MGRESPHYHIATISVSYSKSYLLPTDYSKTYSKTQNVLLVNIEAANQPALIKHQ